MSHGGPNISVGLAPWAKITWKDATTNLPFANIVRVPETNRAIRNFSNPGKMKIVLFATGWKYSNPEDIQELKENEFFRLTTPQYVPSIIHGPHLWVVAAGGKVSGVDINKQFDESPMNIGDQKNVLVVAACRNCASSSATLTDYSNFSTEGLVHIAAYGEPFPAPATSTEYALASGTSQASALVAGLAAAMACQWPDSYQTPRELKIRLQTAVFPPLDERLRKGVTGGVVDAKKALLNPTQHHVAAHGNRARAASSLEWCTEALRPESLWLAGADAPGGPVKPLLLRHIVASKINDDRAFFLFHESDSPEEQAAGTVKRTGPGRFPEDSPLVRVTYADQKDPGIEVLRASEIDFILTPTLAVESAETFVSAAACQ
ncbi:S8 family serine peptidase (plasmid) [Rhizobium johnstonii]|nr:S8 family serine peptidase [Rhizobium johnstonii]